MTAINVIVRADRVEMLTDGWHGRTDGTMMLAPKAFPVPNLRAAFALRGYGALLPALVLRLCDSFESFDALVAGAGEVIKAALEPLPPEARTDLVIAGWSESRGRPEAYAVFSYAENGIGAPAFTAVPLDPGMVTPIVPVDDLDMEANDFLVESARRQEAAYPGQIGGFWQRTTVWRDQIETSVVGERLGVA